MDKKHPPRIPLPVGTLATRRRAKAAVIPFAGRIGGNQAFVISPDNDDEQAEQTLKNQPDAAPLTTLSDSLNLRGFLVEANWKGAIIEGWATALLVFVLGIFASGLSDIDIGPVTAALVGALGNVVALSLFIFAAGPASGGQLNPVISMATFFTGLSTFPRTVLYITAQSVGAIIGAYLIKLGLGGDAFFASGVVPGCTVTPSLTSPGQMFVLEYMISQALIFIDFGVGLDPRQASVFGPSLSPILVGFSLGLGTLVTTFAKPGYSGASLNPARCLGLMVAKNDMQYHYIHWLAPLLAAMVNGVFYHYLPPYVKEKKH